MRSVLSPRRVLELAARTMACPTAPYREGAVISWLREFARNRSHLQVRFDRHYNLELRRRGLRPSPSPLVFAAHMDHPGFRALGGERRGMNNGLDALFLGGVAPEYFLPGARVRFFGPDTSVRARVVGLRRRGRQRGLRVELEAEAPVAPGSFGMWNLPAFRSGGRNPDRIESRAADDLAGVAAILALFDRVEAIDPTRRVDVRALFSRAEEVGFLGALAVARAGRLPPQSRLIVVEASKAFAHAPIAGGPVAGGPVLRVGDWATLFDDELSRWMAAVGEELGRTSRGRFRFQRQLMDGGTCEATAYRQYGYRVAGMCLPLGNYHNMNGRGRVAAESISRADLVGLARFGEGLVRADALLPGRGERRSGAPLRRRLRALSRDADRELVRDPWA